MYRYWERLSALTNDEIQTRIHTFNKSQEIHGTVIFCVNCGSTNLDQNSINQLHCYNCRQVMTWNGFRFSIGRPRTVDKYDVPRTFERFAESSYDEWHRQVEDGVGNFIQAIVEDALSPTDFSEARLEELEKKWERCKKVVDMYFRDRRDVDKEPEDIDW